MFTMPNGRYPARIDGSLFNGRRSFWQWKFRTLRIPDCRDPSPGIQTGQSGTDNAPGIVQFLMLARVNACNTQNEIPMNIEFRVNGRCAWRRPDHFQEALWPCSPTSLYHI